MDSTYCYIHRPRPLLDIVDEEWLKDCLPEDDIDIPTTIDVVTPDAEADQWQSVTKPSENGRKWTELGLQEYLTE